MVKRSEYEALQKEFTNYKLFAENESKNYRKLVKKLEEEVLELKKKLENEVYWHKESNERGLIVIDNLREEIDSLKIRVFDKFIGGENDLEL